MNPVIGFLGSGIVDRSLIYYKRVTRVSVLLKENLFDIVLNAYGIFWILVIFVFDRSYSWWR